MKFYVLIDIVLLVEYEFFYYMLEKDVIKKYLLLNLFLFWYEGKDVFVKVYNVDMMGNDVYINDKKMKKEYSFILFLFVMMGLSDVNYIYVI